MNRQHEPASTHKQRSPWWVVIGSGLSTAVYAGPFILATFSLFIVPIAAETGFARETVTVAFTVAALGIAIGTPIAGLLLDRFAFRVVVVPAFVLYGLCIALVSVAPPTLPLFYLPYFFLGLFAGGTFIPFTKAVLSWFDNKRGIALGLTAALGALGTLAAPLFAGWLIRTHGWRTAYPWMGLVAVVVALVMIFAFVRVRAERSVRGRLVRETVEEDHVVPLELPGLTLGKAVATRHFWIIAGTLCVVGAAIQGVQVNVVPLMTDQGMPPAQAALLLSVYGLASLLGRLLGGLLLDRVHAPFLAAVVFLAPVVGLFFLNPPFASAALAMALIGVAFGIEIDLLGFFISRYLGLRRLGSLLGVLSAAVTLAGSFGPLLVSLAYARTGSYSNAFPYLGGALVVCAAAVLLLGGYRYPALHGFDRAVAQDELAVSGKLAQIADAEQLTTTVPHPATSGQAR